MRWMRLGKIVLCILLFSAFFLGPGTGMAIEEAKYKVLEREGDFELRQYEPQIVAETLVEGDFQDVGNEGFRRLYDYISGKNRKQQTIPMTAPVSQEAASEKIPMTAPVNQEKVGGEMADHLHDASSIHAGNSPGTLGPESAVDQGSGTAHGCPELFRHLEQGAL